MITLGSDPELFLRDIRTGGVVSAVGLIGGTKQAPIPMEGMPEGYAMQEDNVMVEFNVPPTSTTARFARSITSALDHINHVVRTTREDLVLDTGSCARLFRHDQLDNPQARMFGCSPDFNAHEQGQPWPRIDPELLTVGEEGAWRFAGGHVHIGYESSAPEFVAAAFADVFIGLPSVGLDKQGLRRELYGKAGRYRPTSFGIEYRTLSNFWIWDPSLAKQVGERAYRLGAMLEGDMSTLQRLYAEVPWIDVQDAINSEDLEKAADLLTFLRNDLAMEV